MVFDHDLLDQQPRIGLAEGRIVGSQAIAEQLAESAKRLHLSRQLPELSSVSPKMPAAAFHPLLPFDRNGPHLANAPTAAASNYAIVRIAEGAQALPGRISAGGLSNPPSIYGVVKGPSQPSD
jgi:hypothetical protein